MNVRVVEGDILDQPVEAIVNAWNRNTIPWWLLLPQGVSGAIKRRGGTAPFRELRRHGRMALGEAVSTGAGRLPFRGIVHVAGIDDLWRGSPQAAGLGAANAVREAERQGFASLAIPLLGGGSWCLSAEASERAILEALREIDSPVQVTVVRYQKP